MRNPGIVAPYSALGEAFTTHRAKGAQCPRTWAPHHPGAQALTATHSPPGNPRVTATQRIPPSPRERASQILPSLISSHFCCLHSPVTAVAVYL